MSKKVLIISDNRAGHLNQSKALAELKNLDYDIVCVSYTNKIYKFISYLFDWLNIYTSILFNHDTINNTQYSAVIATGSTTYYPGIYFAKLLNIKAISTMLPKGYRLDSFDQIIAQSHDTPPVRDNILTLPVNLNVNHPLGYVKHDKKSKYVGVIIGGNNKIFNMSTKMIKDSLDQIFTDFQNHKKLITTSPRTAIEIEKLCLDYRFDYQLIYSNNPKVNPIPDFINICDDLFITCDSTSMISEAASNSAAKIHIIELESTKLNTKFHKLIDNIKNNNDKIDLKSKLKKVTI